MTYLNSSYWVSPTSFNAILMLFIIAPLLACVLLILNYLFSHGKRDNKKISPFECGFSCFSQTRSPFHIHFFLVALLFMVFDIEIALVYPYVVSSYNNQSYGFVILIIFLALLTCGFVHEIGKKALNLKDE